MPQPSLLFVCTGNATRSVIAEAIVRRERPEWPVFSSGTLAIPGLPSSRRTLAALAAVGVEVPGHRSRTLTAPHLLDADLVIVFERHHVAYIRRHHPEAAHRTATLPRFLRDDDWLTADLALESPEDWDEIDDPAGRDVDEFVACARTIESGVLQLLPRLESWPSADDAR